jgi:hypothetical protein
MKNTLIKIFLVFLITFKVFAVDVAVTGNKQSCVGLMLSFFDSDTTYVTYRKLPEALPAKLTEKAYANSKIDSKPLRFNNAFFHSLKAKEVVTKDAANPLSALNQKELYTFVVTEKEIRFASTTRGFSPKNLATKHALLANNTDPVFYAGEAWFENGVLVINHGSGTFKPSSKDLADVALYFQKAFGVEKVSFNDVLPVIVKKSLQDHVNDFRAYVMSKITTLEEMFVNLIARDAYKGQKIKLGLDGLKGDDIEFEVKDFIGSGFFGVVHKVKIKEMSDAAKKAFPDFMVEGEFRKDLVVKFPHNIPMLNHFPSFNIFDQTIVKENDEISKLKMIIDEFNQDAADVIFKGTTERPFLLKKLVKASSIQSLAKMGTKLTDDQVKALKRDIFEMATTVADRMKLDLDIKAENIAWDEVNKKFVMYELSFKAKTTGFYIKNGFNGYLNYVNQRMLYHSKTRTPSSAGVTINMCPSNTIEVPNDFKFHYQSDLYDGSIDLVNNVINLDTEGLSGCFKVESVTYTKEEAFLNLRIQDAKKSNKYLDFVIQRDLGEEKSNFLTRFMTFVDGKPVAYSIFADTWTN